MNLTPLTAVSPVDGRYHAKTAPLYEYFSEYALIKFRVTVELKWLGALSLLPEIELAEIPEHELAKLINGFSLADGERIKEIERQTNHDVKAVEYFIREKLKSFPELKDSLEYVHFACTSEDINNLAHGLMVKGALDHIILPQLSCLIREISRLAHEYADIPMLSRTHGQPASPTTMGKEMANFARRLKKQVKLLKKIKIMGKINGAVGNFNAHLSVYPDINWLKFARKFIRSLGLDCTQYTTQIEPHDYLAEIFHAMIRINNILLDFDRDMWTYIGFKFFTQKPESREVGSSTMPHKVNPIDFENSEGNIGIANALLEHFANKLPVSRLQRDLSDSTVIRNMGSAFAHSLIAYEASIKGIGKLEINPRALLSELENSWEVMAEPIQTVMRRYNIANPYEKLKQLTRGREISRQTIHEFIATLEIPQDAKQELLNLTPQTYTGLAASLARKA